MFTSKLLSTAPQIATRRALLILDLQNDFVKSDGVLPVKNVADFLPQITDLARTFRDTAGEVIWVQTQFEECRPAANEATGGETIILGDSPSTPSNADNTSTARGGSRRRTPQSKLARDKNNKNAVTHNCYPEDREAFLTVSDDTISSFGGRRCCLPNSTGFQFPAPILSAIDYSKDTVLVKSDYSAFQSPNLLLSLRTKFVTEVFICGSLSNASVHATVIDAVGHGLSVTLIEDCLGYRNFSRHKEAMRRMADIMGANGITSGELVEGQQREGTKSPSPPPTDPLPDSMEERMGGLGVSPPAQSDSSDLDDPSSIPPPASRRRRMEQSPKPNYRQHRPTRRRKGSDGRNKRDGEGHFNKEKQSTSLSDAPGKESHAHAPSPTQISTSELTNERPSRKQKTYEPVNFGPGDSVGAGDSRIVYDLDLPSNAFQLLRDEVNWQKMYHMSGQVPRLVAVQGAVQPDGSVPIYRHPADESPPLFPFTNTVDLIRRVVERSLGHPLNHVLIQLYRSGQDRISEHSDKTLDIVRGSNICNVSLGAQRAMTLRTKADAKATSTEASTKENSNNKGSVNGRQSQKVPMPHNSLFVLGEATNMKWLHAIRPDKRPESTKSAEELAFNGERISLTFRHIGTFINPKADTIWGQGASSKNKENAGKIVHGQSSETELMIHAFGQENHQTDYNWDEHYGRGFDVVNFVTTSTAKLVLSGDNLLDLRVRLCLVENGIRYDVVGVDELPSGSINAPTTQDAQKPALLDPDGTTFVTGDLNILTHIAHHLRGQDTPDAEHRTNGFTLQDRLNAAEELLHGWRQYTHGELESIYSNLSWFETLLHGNLYITGRKFGVDDCALWPVLREMFGQKGVVPEDKFPSLVGYYSKVSKRACVKQVLEESTATVGMG